MEHIPVLKEEVIQGLSLKKGDVVLDATIGLGGHAKKILEVIGQRGILIGLDLDPFALERAEQSLSHIPARKIFIAESYRQLPEVLKREGIERIDAALFDLGVGSHQLFGSGRGFSFLADEPLAMTFFPRNKITAESIVNAASFENLAMIIKGYGGERNAGKIARAIVLAREERPIKTTRDLVTVIEKVIPRYGREKVHPATKTFQALRMAVNDELSAITESLPYAFSFLDQGGRLAVIAFHSLEDRIVKNYFKAMEMAGEGKLITKKPITPSVDEISDNPRSRSAKLRIIEKI